MKNSIKSFNPKSPSRVLNKVEIKDRRQSRGSNRFQVAYQQALDVKNRRDEYSRSLKQKIMIKVSTEEKVCKPPLELFEVNISSVDLSSELCECNTICKEEEGQEREQRVKLVQILQEELEHELHSDIKTSVISASAFVCSICLDDNAEGLLQLTSCRHHAHATCLEQQLKSRWPGNKISFGYLSCPECRSPLQHNALTDSLASHLKLKSIVENLCLQQADADGIGENDVTQLKAQDRGTYVDQCMSTFACFLCSKCSEPFCGGRLDCAQDDAIDVSALKCPSCLFASVETGTGLKDEESSTKISSDVDESVWRGKCVGHGYKYAIYKCDSCCAVATWDCRSNHYCERCHNMAYSAKDFPCPGKDCCPLGIEHPPNKPAVHGAVDNGFVIGCSLCFLGGENSQDFVLATDLSSQEASDNWKDRF